MRGLRQMLILSTVNGGPDVDIEFNQKSNCFRLEVKQI